MQKMYLETRSEFTTKYCRNEVASWYIPWYIFWYAIEQSPVCNGSDSGFESHLRQCYKRIWTVSNTVGT